MKKWGWIVFFPWCGWSEPLTFNIRGEAAILMNAETGQILFEQDAYQLHYPASTTKIATALYLLELKGENLDVSFAAEQDSLGSVTQAAKRKSNFTLPAYWLEPDGTHIGIKKGEELSLRDLLKGMLISSGNDASNVIAQAVSPSIPAFMEGLNLYVKSIGCQQTHFCNPHGLHDPSHQTTPYDLAIMFREALKKPILCDIFMQTRFMRPKTNKQAATTCLQGNRLVRPGKFYYSKAIGGKTGYHAKAKNTFVSAARFNDRTLILVLMGYQDRSMMFEDAIKLFETAFNQPKVQRRYLKAGLQTFSQSIPKANQALQTYLQEPLTFDYYPSEDPQAKCLLYWQELALPIAKDQQVGELQLVTPQGECLKKVSLLAAEEVHLAWPYSWFASFSWLWVMGGVGIGLLGFKLRR